METTVMTEFLASMSQFLTTSLEWVGDVLNVITANPALMIVCIGMPVVGFGVGLLNRLFRVN